MMALAAVRRTKRIPLDDQTSGVLEEIAEVLVILGSYGIGPSVRGEPSKIDSARMFSSSDIQRRYERVIECLSLGSQRYFGHSDMPVFVPVDLVSRPSSEIVKCRVRFETAELMVYIKLFLLRKTSKSGVDRIRCRMKGDVEITSLLYARLGGNAAQSVPRIVAYFPEEMVVITEESNGDPLLSVIDNYAGGSPRRKILEKLGTQCHSVGRWLNEFQRITATNSRIHELETKVIGYVDLRLRKLSTASNLTTSNYKAVLDYLERKLATVNQADIYACGVHGDFGPSNILVSSDHVTVLDFAMYNIGLPYTDPSYLYQRLEGFLTKPIFRLSTIAFLQRAFLDGYQQGFDLKHPLFEVSRVRHMVNRLVDLASTNELTTIKMLYQRWQYKKCLADLMRIVRTS